MTAEDHRVTIGADTLVAALSAHVGPDHDGPRGTKCPICREYLYAIVEAQYEDEEER